MNEHMESNKSEPSYTTRIIGEPVTKPNGWRLELAAYADSTLLVRDGPMTTYFQADEIVELGAGNYEAGIVIVGRAYYGADPGNIFDAVDTLTFLLEEC